jgi:hypothetical protein
VREFVCDDVEAFCEAVEELPVADTVDHVLAVPEGVVEARPIVNGRVKSHALSIDGIATEVLTIKVVCVAAVIKCLIHGHGEAT